MNVLGKIQSGYRQQVLAYHVQRTPTCGQDAQPRTFGQRLEDQGHCAEHVLEIVEYEQYMLCANAGGQRVHHSSGVWVSDVNRSGDHA